MELQRKHSLSSRHRIATNDTPIATPDTKSTTIYLASLDTSVVDRANDLILKSL